MTGSEERFRTDPTQAAIGPEGAYTAVQLLVALTAGEWEEAVIRAWVGKIARLLDYDAACEASRLLSESWTRTTNPPYGAWLELYRSAAARNTQTRLEIPEQTGPRMPLAEYLALLEARAARGDRSAATELDRWRHTSPNVLHALTDDIPEEVRP